MRADLKIEAFVLAGGKSSRMGRDKGLVLLNGKPMVSYVLDALGKIALPTQIIANDSAYHYFGLPVIADVINEKGPMGGLYTAFQNTKADVVFILSCDMPLISSEAVTQLLSEANKEHIVAATVKNKVNPLFALYPAGLKDTVEEHILTERLKMTDLILANKHVFVPSIANKRPWSFQNINNESELKKLEKEMESLTIKAFGMLVEKLPAPEFEFPFYKNTEELLARLCDEFPDLRSLDFRVAVNKQLIQENTSLVGNEEIALLPPFSGG